MPFESRASGTPALRLLDAAVLGAAILSVAFLIWRTPAPDGPDLIPSTWFVDAVFAGIGMALFFVCWRLRRSSSLPARLIPALLTMVLAGMAMARLRLLNYERDAASPLTLAGATSASAGGTPLSPGEAAEWAVRVALHAAPHERITDDTIEIPANWPLPATATLGVRDRAERGREIWARVAGAQGTVTCHVSVAPEGEFTADLQFTPSCDTTTALPAGVVLGPPVRGAGRTSLPSPPSGAAPWVQHRGNASRAAAAPGGPSTPTAWHATTHTPVRADVSVVGELVLVGGHGSGLLVALDRSNGVRRWSAQLPNWIHQAPVSDGQVVAVGFGDNDRSFGGHAPSGVAAYDLVSGRRLWTEFENGSVMTSPAIHDSIVAYVTSNGVLRVRLLVTGQLLGTTQLPGGVIMGPPVLTGDTLVVTLDPNNTCGVDLSPLRVLWCLRQNGLRMVGHASAAIKDGIIVASGVATAGTPGLSSYVALPLRLQAEMLKALLFPEYLDYRVAHFPGQVFSGINLATGKVRWTSPFFARRRSVDGHTSGTAALQGGIGVIVLPVADTVVAFEPTTGTIRWTSGANQARGAPLILGNQVIISGRNGVIEVRQLESGVLQCTLRRERGYDRAGPILTEGMLVFANLDGEIEAIPTADLLTCHVGDGT